MAVLFTVLLGLAVFMLAYLIYNSTQQSFIRETRAAIDVELASILEMQALLPNRDIEDLIEGRQARSSQLFYQLVDSAGHPLAGDLLRLPDKVDRLAEGLISMRLKPDMVSSTRLQEPRQVAALVHTFPDGRRLLIARDIDAIAAGHYRLQWLGVIAIVLMLLVVLTSFFLSTFVVSRINVIAATANDIMDTGDLSRRISIDSKWDDLSNLAQILNALFARIEVLMKDVRRVSDNIAHDLRTPLSRMRNQLEELRDIPETQEHADHLIREADGLLSTFSSLLRIANIEVGKQRQFFKDVEMVPLVQDIVELYAPIAEEKRIIISTQLETTSLTGDRDLLFQMLANLLDNAIKFTPSGGEICITLSADKGRVIVVVADSGPGIAEGDRDKVFNRFYRAEESRHTPGSGLGLSLVAAIVELHKGTIYLADNNPGLRAEIVFT